MGKFNIHSNLAISAGAGTGKTYTLSRRYINILLGFNFFRESYPGQSDFSMESAVARRADPREVTTITYTEAGAGEMKSRINELISLILRHIDGQTVKDDSIATALRYYGKLQAYIRERLQECRTKMIYARISTIHSFALSLLRENADIIQIDLAPTIISSAEKTRIFTESLHQAFEAHESEALDLLMTLGNFRLQKVASKFIYDARFRRYVDDFSSSSLSGQDLLKVYQQIKISEHFEDVIRIIEDYKASESYAKNPDKYKAYGDYILQVFQGLVSFQPLSGRATAIFQVEEEGKEARDRFNHALKTLKSIPVDLNDGIEKGFLETLKKIRTILRDCYDSYLSAMNESGMIDFDLIVSLAAEMVDGGRISTDCKYYMIDEFQDTNEVQWNMILRLAGNAGANIFLVGDEKQSIYSFQGAEVETFGRAVVESAANTIPMTDNRRSTRDILAFVNETFAPLFRVNDRFDLSNVPEEFKHTVSELDKLRLKGISRLKYEDLTYPADSQKSGETSITYLVAKDSWTADPDLTQNDAEYENIARLIHQIKNGQLKQYKDVTEAMRSGKKAVSVLFNSRNGMRLLKEKLDEYGVNCLANYKESFYQAKEVSEVFHLLKLLFSLTPETEWQYLNRFNLAGALRGSVLRIPDDCIHRIFREQDITEVRKVMEPYVNAARSLSLASLISFIIDKSDLKTVYLHYPDFKQRIANLDKLVQLAIAFENEHLYDPKRFIADLETSIFYSDDADEDMAPFDADGMDSVILTTIHASKGLQYPMVLMPQMTTNVLRAGGSESFKFGKAFLSDQDSINMIGFKVNGERPIAYNLSSAISTRQDLEEKKRLFYVALTRAEKHIVISIPELKKLPNNSFLRFLSYQYGDDLQDAICEFAGSVKAGRKQSKSKAFKNATLLMLPDDEITVSALEKQPQIVVDIAHRPLNLDQTVDSVTGNIDHDEFVSLSDASLVGTAFHELIASSFDFIEDSNKVGNSIDCLLKKHQLPDEKRGKMKSMVQNFINHPLYADIKQADERYFEKDFNIKTDEGIQRGTIDLLYRSGDDWHIIDFKTNNLKDTTEAEITKKNDYDRQLEQYGAAIEQSLGIEVQKQELMYVNREITF
ncbi:UvrD-helicase domain-containing protein [bacterium]|nr:UvrD-helicase domain-containing protein [bacterium]